MKIYTLGTSTRSLEEFLEILKAYKIKQVIDIRRFPTSRNFPHFKKENLEKSLKNERIDYVWMGNELGGFRKGGYKEYMETEEFEQGLEDLVKKAEKKRSVIICTEFLWFKCHRNYVSQILSKEHKVIHILGKDRIEKHYERETEDAICERRKITREKQSILTQNKIRAYKTASGIP